MLKSIIYAPCSLPTVCKDLSLPLPSKIKYQPSTFDFFPYDFLHLESCTNFGLYIYGYICNWSSNNLTCNYWYHKSRHLPWPLWIPLRQTWRKSGLCQRLAHFKNLVLDHCGWVFEYRLQYSRVLYALLLLQSHSATNWKISTIHWSRKLQHKKEVFS